MSSSRLAGALAALGVNFVVVGSCALVLRGEAQSCADLDIVPQPSTANLLVLVGALRALGALAVPSVEALRSRPVVSLASPYGRIDVFSERGREEFDALFGAADITRVDDAIVTVASRTDLLRLRARFKDSTHE